MALWETIAAASQVQRFTFYLDPLVDGQTDANLAPVEVINPVMPYSGSIVGLAATADEAAGTGVTTFDAKTGSTQYSIDISLAAAATNVYARYAPGRYPIAAGALFGASYTSGTLGTNAGVRLDVFVLFDDVRS